MRRARPLLLVCAALAVAAAASIARGQDTNFDQLRAHYYGLYWLFHGRQGADFFPAQLGGLLPFFWNVPWYLLVNRVDPRITAAFLGVLNGLPVVLVAVLTWRLVARRTSYTGAILVVGIVTVFGATGPGFVGEFGTTFGDAATAIPFLAGLVMLLWTGTISRRPVVTFLAMSLVGASAGLKLTNVPWAVACMLGLLVAARGPGKRRQLLGAAGGMIVGFLLADGPWALLMYRNYGSPTFPLFNAIFRSTDYLAVNFRDKRWAIRSPVDLVTLPFTWLTTSHRTSQAGERDWRWFALLVMGAVWLAKRVGRAAKTGRRPPGDHWEERQVRAKPVPLIDAAASRFVVTLVAAGLPLSLLQLAYTRYLVIGELLAGLVFVCLLEATFSWQAHRATRVAAIAAAVMLLSSSTQSWGTVPLAKNWFKVKVRDPPHDALVLVVGEQPFQYVLPFLPPSNRFGAIGKGSSEFAAAYRRFGEEVRSFRGDIFLLSSASQRALLLDPVLEDLQRDGLTFIDHRCSEVDSVSGQLWLCRLQRTPG